MKKIFTLIMCSVIISCGSQKTITQDNSKNKGEVLFDVPCSGPEYSNSKEFFRANSFGESTDHLSAKRKALTSARRELAAKVEVMVNSFNRDFMKDSEMNNISSIEEQYTSMTTETVKTKLSGINTICEQSAITADGKYKFYVAIELSGQELLGELNERLSNNDLLKISYDEEKYKVDFEKAMENYGK